MKRLMNILRGMLMLRITGPFPERFVNLCAQTGVEFWGVEWLDEHTIRLTARRTFKNQLLHLAQRAGCQVEVEGRYGLPDFLLRFRSRYAFLLGLTFALCAVAFLSRFVLTIQVSGNERVPTAVILSQLQRLGVRPGVYGPRLDRTHLAQEALLELEDLAWMGMNLHGTRLEVIVREKIPEPERIDEMQWHDVVAEADGIITHVEAELGDARVQEGDIVLEGERLISGTVRIEPPMYSDLPIRTYQTHARGRVWARTWRTLTAVIPTQITGKEKTGEKANIWSVELWGRRVEIFGNSSISWPFYDKITTSWLMTLPGGIKLPVAIRRETLQECRETTKEVNRTSAQALLEEQLLQRLEQLVGEGGQVEQVRFSVRETAGMLTVTVRAECQEEIGKEVPGTLETTATINSGELRIPVTGDRIA